MDALSDIPDFRSAPFNRRFLEPEPGSFLALAVETGGQVECSWKQGRFWSGAGQDRVP